MDTSPDSTAPARGPAQRLAGGVALAVATLTGNLALLFGSLVFALLALAVSAVPPRGDWTFRVARLWGRFVLAASFVRVRASFAAELPPDGRFVLMPNHQSHYDIPALLAAWPRQTRFMAKASLFRIPVFGWAMRAGGFVPVDRRDLSRARDAFTAAVARLDSGSSVLIFPEQERSFDGRLLPFQRGGFLLALKSGLPILPVGIEGAFAVQPRGSLTVRPGTVHVRFGTPIPVDGQSVRRRDEWVGEVRAQVAALARTSFAPGPERPPAAEGGSAGG